MKFVLAFLRKIGYRLTFGRLPKNLYKIGKGSIMQPFGIRLIFKTKKDVRNYVTIGEKSVINADFIFETETGKIDIGNNVHIGGANFICRTGISIGNDVTMAWGITLYDHNSHSVNWEDRMNDNHQCYDDLLKYGNNITNKDWSNVVQKPIRIEDKTWIGFDVTILKGISIGEGAIIGAKSVVTRNIPAWTVAAGNPAKVIKHLKD
jgi:acetyltransferase-like isoleucine patch superfamily enzyme